MGEEEEALRTERAELLTQLTEEREQVRIEIQKRQYLERDAKEEEMMLQLSKLQEDLLLTTRGKQENQVDQEKLLQDLKLKQQLFEKEKQDIVQQRLLEQEKEKVMQQRQEEENERDKKLLLQKLQTLEKQAKENEDNKKLNQVKSLTKNMFSHLRSATKQAALNKERTRNAMLEQQKVLESEQARHRLLEAENERHDLERQSNNTLRLALEQERNVLEQKMNIQKIEMAH